MHEHLRTVGDDERAAPPIVHANVTDALEGSNRDVLASIRKTLADKLDAGLVSSNSLASVSKELRELDRLIRSADADRHAEEVKRSDDDRHQRRSFNPQAI